MNSVFLIGPRGAGKSAAGAQLAARLELEFVDVDALIEAQAGRSIANIFANEGEAAFRQLERQQMHQLLDAEHVTRVVATGGGCVVDPGVRQRLSQREGVIWLSAAIEVLQQRVRGSMRPSLTGDDPAAELPHIVRQREPLYREAGRSGAAVDTGAQTAEQVAEEIAALIRG